MLNASYNLPSEDCNTTKQMVFHSNKLLCVYSLQPWLSDTFTFSSELTCFCQMGRHTGPPGKGPDQGDAARSQSPMKIQVKVRSRGGVCLSAIAYLHPVPASKSVRSHILFRVTVASMRRDSTPFQNRQKNTQHSDTLCSELQWTGCECWSQVTGQQPLDNLLDTLSSVSGPMNMDNKNLLMTVK